MNSLVRVTTLCVIVLFAPQAWAENQLPNDPYFMSKGAWGQAFGDQWALPRIGFTPKGTGTSAWDVETGETRPVIVAVIDTGIDYYHPDLRPESIWHNPSPNKPGQDPNHYDHDIIGWNFVDQSNNPWDNDGHGTFVAGIIAAAANNGTGIAGLNWGVKIMPLKVMDSFGRGRGFNVARAIVYAVDHGARIINLSLDEEHLTKTEELAVDYAFKKGALIVVAAGNQGANTEGTAPVSLPHVLAVAALDQDDKRAPFSNWGTHIKLAAPGVDILSLRARRTDLILMSGAPNYTAGSAFVGPDAQYLRASGTSFSAPMVAAVASLIWAKFPALTNVHVERMLLESADDVEEPGWDNFTGAGRLNAVAAMKADPDYFLTAKISQVTPTKVAGKTAIQVSGTAVGSRLASYELQLGQGEHPSSWKTVGTFEGQSVEDGVLGTFPVKEITAKGKWLVRVIARDGKKVKEARGTLNVK